MDWINNYLQYYSQDKNGFKRWGIKQPIPDFD